jgi:hypothetical protein
VPRLLREHPEARNELYGLMVATFPTREELSEELRAMRDEARSHFQQQMAQVHAAREESSLRFNQVDQRLDQQAAETRALRESTDQRFNQVDQRLDQQAAETRALRESTDQRFDAVDQHLGQVDQHLDQQATELHALRETTDRLDRRVDGLEKRMDAGFRELQQSIDRLGQRWGIQNESVFRQTIATLLEKSFGAQVQTRTIDGEQYDVVVMDGAHILIEIAASAGPKIKERLERKRQSYIDATGVVPARVVFATASIHSRRAEVSRAAGFEVIEPEGPEEEQATE